MANRRVSENFELGIAHPVDWPGVTLDSECGFTYTGGVDALIAAGLVRHEWVPGDPKCPNKITFTTRIDGRLVHVRRAPQRKFSIAFEAIEAERDTWVRRQDLDRDAKHIAKFEASLPADQESFRKGLMAEFCSVFGTLERPQVLYVDPHWLSMYVDGSGGYRLSPSTLQQLSDLMHEGLAILRSSPVTFDAARRQREIATVRLDIAKDDPAFQDLLSTTVGAKGRREAQNGH